MVKVKSILEYFIIAIIVIIVFTILVIITSLDLFKR